MPALSKTVGVTFGLAGCPNRCRRCYLSAGPNRRGRRDFLGELAAAFWTWRRPGATVPCFAQVESAPHAARDQEAEG
jgi:hypothetical protein